MELFHFVETATDIGQGGNQCYHNITPCLVTRKHFHLSCYIIERFNNSFLIILGT
jgi:hypothetical protein